MTDRKLMQQALEALETLTVDAKTTPNAYEAQRQAITALRAAIEQAHDWDEVEALRASLREHMAEIRRLRQWQGLTDDEIVLIYSECAASTHQTDDLSYARAIEAKLQEKNT